MTILRTDKIAGLDSVSAITGSVFFGNGDAATAYDSLVTDASSDYTMGTGDFNLEGWFYLNNVTTTWQILISDTLYGDTGGWSFYANGAQLNFWKGGSSVVSGGTLTANTWHHLAFSREGGTNRIFVDGVVAGTATDSTDYTDNRISVGANNVDKGGILGAYGLNGYASNVRVCKGHAVYDKAFTPPTRELLQHYTSPGNESVLLCCQSSQDAGQDATGRTLSVRGNARPTTFVPDVGNDHTHGTVLEGGTAFSSLNYMTLPRGTTTQSNRGRGLLMGGYTPTPTGTNLNTITYIDIASSGHDVDFGDLSQARYASGAFSSSTRGILGGGRTPTRVDTIDYVTIAQTGNAIDFGNLHAVNAYNQGTSNETRGLFLGGNTPTYITRIDYVTIASTGDAADFGDLTDARHGGPGVSSPTRAICMGGYDGPAFVDVIDYVTIATLGDATDFGDLTSAYGYGGGVSNATRGLVGGGANPSGEVTHMDYITIATTGDSKDFGDLVYGREHTGAVSNSTRGVWFGGVTPTYQTDIQYAIIATTGSAADWGELYVPNGIPKGYQSGASDSHGGLV